MFQFSFTSNNDFNDQFTQDLRARSPAFMQGVHNQLQSWLNVTSLRYKKTTKYVEYLSGSIPGDVAGIFSEATDGTMCPGVDSASKNEYQENSWV
jgi:hypothetical protein